jgi:hypothetical protein
VSAIAGVIGSSRDSTGSIAINTPARTFAAVCGEPLDARAAPRGVGVRRSRKYVPNVPSTSPSGALIGMLQAPT